MYLSLTLNCSQLLCVCRNKNLQLSKEEFMGFLHPEVEPHMGDIMVSETMADLDKVKEYSTIEPWRI